MNKQTRNFIWGLICLFIGSFALAKSIQYVLQPNYHWSIYILIFFNTYTLFYGVFKITKTL